MAERSGDPPTAGQWIAKVEAECDKAVKDRDQLLAALGEINEYDVSPEVQKILDVALLGADSIREGKG